MNQNTELKVTFDFYRLLQNTELMILEVDIENDL